MAQEEPAEGGAMPPSDQQLEDANQIGTGGSHGLRRSIYLCVSCRDSSFDHKAYNPLYKVEVAAGPSSKEKLCDLLTNGGGKTFVSLPSGRIIGVGGRCKSDSTIIIDTKTTTPKPKVIRGPNLLSAKWCPVVAAVGSKVYALCRSPDYKRKPDFPPWFEVLDLSKGNVMETADGSLSMDGCSWEALPWPGFLPHKLTPGHYDRPPIVSIRSYVLVFPYIVISLNQRASCTYAYDTNSGEWHKIDDMVLPFLGPAIPHGQSGCIFLGLSLENESVNAYRIRVVSTSSRCSTGKGSALKLSVTVLLSLKHDAHEQAGPVAEQHITSLDTGHFCLLSLWIDRRKRSLSNYSDTNEELSGIFSRKLIAKLTTYQIENPALLDQTQDQDEYPEIVVSTLWEQDFKLSSRYGFASPSIFFALST